MSASGLMRPSLAPRRAGAAGTRPCLRAKVAVRTSTGNAKQEAASWIASWRERSAQPSGAASSAKDAKEWIASWRSRSVERAGAISAIVPSSGGNAEEAASWIENWRKKVSGGPGPAVDWEALGLYAMSTALQFAGILVTLKVLDKVWPLLPWAALDRVKAIPTLQAKVKETFVFTMFLFMAFRSRVFSILDNRRPTVSSEEGAIGERKRPSWMPPPIAFPFIWGTIGLLRAASSLMVWKEMSGTFFSFPLAAFMLHLCIGDTWNTVNNVDKRYGFAALGIFGVLASVIFADWAYFQVSSTAGAVLAPSCVWLVVAAALVNSIWRLNGKEPMYPVKATSA